jgi:hypothetical protein
MKAASKRSKPGADPNKYPKGLDREKVAALAAFYEGQSDDDAIAEAEAAYKSKQFTMMAVPTALIPEVQKLIDKQAS